MAASVLESLKRAILEYDEEQAETLARSAIEQGIEPLVALEALTDAIREVGDGFEREELWLPDLVGAASAMKRAAPVIEEEIARRGQVRQSTGKVVIGTVFGDIHDIGKNMVVTLLMASGFEVHDIGVNAPAEDFVAAVKEHRPDILALSALMTVTCQEQLRIIRGLEQEGLREGVKVMVGGAAISDDFAQHIGADGYEASAPAAVVLAKNWVGARGVDR